AEKLTRTEDGKFLQAEVTSCGLNDGPLRGIGKYPARIACNLWSKYGSGRYDCRLPKKVFQKHPYFTQAGKDREGKGNQYIANMRDGSVAGFKYFAIDKANHIRVCLRSRFSGKVQVSTKEDFSEICAEIAVEPVKGKKKLFESRFQVEKGIHALFFRFVGVGAADFLFFELVGQGGMFHGDLFKSRQ
ncbi:MAG: hypothetical protein IJ727_08430, partial [Treponema sp.]|nr:hypothetical protein [Treponema sp.]